MTSGETTRELTAQSDQQSMVWHNDAENRHETQRFDSWPSCRRSPGIKSTQLGRVSVCSLASYERLRAQTALPSLDFFPIRLCGLCGLRGGCFLVCISLSGGIGNARKKNCPIRDGPRIVVRNADNRSHPSGVAHLTMCIESRSGWNLRLFSE